MKIPSSAAGQLSRRLIANYLMFGLLSIVTLAASMLLIIKASQAPSSGPLLVARLAEAASRISAELIQGQTATSRLQQIVDEISDDQEVQYCGVVNLSGVYLAHSDSILTGRKSAVSFSPANMPGVMESITFLREDQEGPKEYWIPLSNGEQVLGVLQTRLQPNETSGLMTLVRTHFGTAVTVPVLLLVLGGMRLRGVVRASATIDEQLTKLVSSEDEMEFALQFVEESSPAGMGWNRLVRRLEKGQVLKNVEDRLNDVLGGVRTQKYEQILHNMAEGVAVTDAAGVATFCNRAFALLLDTEPEALCGQPLALFIPDGLPENLHRFTTHCHEMSRPAVMELQRTKDMADGVLRLARTPFQADDSGTTFQLWSLRDISQLKLVEHSRDQFVDTATHELRTPLSNIKACAETLQIDEDLEEEVRKLYLNTISSEATRLGRFVDEFLNISRMEAGSVSLNRHPTHMERLIREAMDKTRPQFDQKHQEFNCQLPAKLPELSIDKDKISAALVNLLGNAGKYTPEGGKIGLNVELTKTEMRIHVEDSGYGISPEELSKVFNKFFRSDDQRVRDITGTGLGLSFAQEIVRLHGGRISARSELNKGSRFTISLPIA